MLVEKIVPLRYIPSQARIEIVRQGRAYVTLLVCHIVPLAFSFL